MDYNQFNKDFFDFLQKCPTPFHTTEYLKSSFQEAGFTALYEDKDWKIEDGKGYYCIRDDGTIIGIKLAENLPMKKAWRMTAAHSDSPSLQIKPNPLKTS